MNNFKIEYTITNNKKSHMDFRSFESAKEVYISLAYNLTIKKAKLYDLRNNKKVLVEKFNKKRIYPLNEV